MRYIDIQKINLPDNWNAESKTAKDSLFRLTTKKARSDFFGTDNASNLWSNLKDELKRLSHNKCWYCEAKEIRSSGEVDHFRPKGAVSGCKDHEGYWWLALDWENYRYSCELCNRRRKDRITSITAGKGTYFPLLNENQRAYFPKCFIDLEQPLLLDPTDSEDPYLLWFNEDGMVVSKYDVTSPANLRAIKSIELYHLNHSDLKEARIHLSRRIKSLVTNGDIHNRPPNNLTNNQSFKQIKNELMDLTSPSSKFSSAAKAFLKGYRDREWVDDILTRT